MSDTIQNELLKSAELTGDWERKLRWIEKGDYEPDVFKQELIQMVKELTDQVIFNTDYRAIQMAEMRQEQAQTKEKPKKKRAPKAKVNLEELDCPKCKSAKLMKGKAAVGCSNFKACGFKIPFELMGKKLTDNQLGDLIKKGKTANIKGLKNANGEELSGKFLLSNDFNVEFQG